MGGLRVRGVGLRARGAAREHERGVHPGAARAGTSISSRSPTARQRPSPSRSRAASYIAGSGLPATRSAVRPAAVSIAASTAPVAGHGPSGIGNVASRVAPISSAPRSTAWVAIRSSS